MAAIAMMAAIGAWAISTGRISYVITHGASMQPLYHAGDLVFLTKADSYEVGQIAAYHSPSAGIDVLHRITGGDADAGYVLQGDNNDFIDPFEPTADELIGQAILHIPNGGTWLQPVLSPTGLGMLGFLVAGGGASVAKSRRDIARGRRKKRVKRMSGGGGSWATAAAVFKAVSRLHPALRVLALVTAVCGVLGLALGVLGWMKPTTESVTSAGKAGESMTFSYTAEVPRSAAYDGTIAYSPDPIFRKLANLVDLHFSYRGEPGRIQVSARLSSQAGWHQTLQLSRPQQFTADSYTGLVQLDLDTLEQRVKAAQEAIGADLGVITLTITTQVRHSDGTLFEPQLALSLAPLQMSLASGPESLVVDQSSKPVGTSVQDRRIGAFGHDVMTAAQARKYAVYLLLVTLVSAGMVAWMALGHVPLRTRAQIQRRYPHLIVPVEPMASPPGKPVVVVDTFPALVKLAEKYGQMILTWTRPDGADDFVVRDEGILYRYRILPPDAAPEPSPAPKSTQATKRPALAEPEPEATQVPDDEPVELTTEAATTDAPEPVMAAKKAATPRKRAPKAAPATIAAKKAPAKRASRARPKPAPEPEPPAEPTGEVTPETVEIPPTEAQLPEPTIEHPSAAAHAAMLTAAIESAENEGLPALREHWPESSEPPAEIGAAAAPPPGEEPTADKEHTVEPDAGPAAQEAASETLHTPEPAPEQPSEADAEPEPEPKKRTPQKRTAQKRSRRKAVAERAAMEDLAARNEAVKPPEPPREPIYDFLPANKRLQNYDEDA
ncbi:hypothetical protein [Actinoplanes sp. NPDC049802]|uniref:hypothetical protein n=1 Tax=Actinoplanes sp. NPDC049802 TaxID=3154742 RepID=UPI0033F176DE